MLKILTISDDFGRYELSSFQNDEGKYGTPFLEKKKGNEVVDAVTNDEYILNVLLPCLLGGKQVPSDLVSFMDEEYKEGLIGIITEGIKIGFFDFTDK